MRSSRANSRKVARAQRTRKVVSSVVHWLSNLAFQNRLFPDECADGDLIRTLARRLSLVAHAGVIGCFVIAAKLAPLAQNFPALSC